ncbi:sodium channel, voltage-gated, type IV, beta a [Erpetoichthys calabaricus]|uniref:Sodium channel, voltage-gated, type IV, beta b n=1 Tax=Erpetoichthys calabaricus TaxID=27687 RepID=A0A8C4SNK2_ERPCA|nr:sodium channel, voltage-gated, type IV, beta a [Erpetoichthys calabaricus]
MWRIPPETGLLLVYLIGLAWLPAIQPLEVSVGKTSSLEALNGTDVLLPCTFSSCIGFDNLYFEWSYDQNGTKEELLKGTIKSLGMEPRVQFSTDRVVFAGNTKLNNISIILFNIDFEDSGKYTCYAMNPREKYRDHQAVFTLTVVSQMKVVDKTLTIIIASAVGGVIGLIIVIMILKKLIVFIIAKTREKNKECLVSSSGIDNTENGLSGSKPDTKATPKA